MFVCLSDSHDLAATALEQHILDNGQDRPKGMHTSTPSHKISFQQRN